MLSLLVNSWRNNMIAYLMTILTSLGVVAITLLLAGVPV